MIAEDKLEFRRPIDATEYFELSRMIERHHALFYSVWCLGVPTFTKSIPTAAVSFDSSGEHVDFIFNPDFWDSLTQYEKVFVICHECLHVALKHGLRAVDAKPSERQACNIAMDVVVNHLLVDRFEFDREKIRNWSNFCWVDTVFKDRTDISEGESFEYYYSILKEELESGQGSSGGEGVPSLVDDHSGLEGSGQLSDEVIDKLNEAMTGQEKESVRDVLQRHTEQGEDDGQQAGNSAGGQWKFVDVGPQARKKKWESVIKQWSKKYKDGDFKDRDQWARTARRFATIGENMFLPTSQEVEVPKKSKVDVWFFQDTSGSCRGYIDRFFAAALTLDPKKFDIKLCCFDTRVYETTLESRKLYGFGGTRFDIIEDYIQAKIKSDNLPYPEAVFVITDGYGNVVQPEKPSSWYWFLTVDYRYCLPKDSNIFPLSQFE